MVKQRRIATNSRVGRQKIDPTNGDQRILSNSRESLDELDDPEVILDEFDGTLQFPTDIDEGKELHDNGAIQKAALSSMNYMKLHYGVFMPDEYACEMCGFSNHLYESQTDSIAFAKLRESVKDTIPSRIQLPEFIDSTCWQDELRCSEFFQNLRASIETIISDTSHNLSKYKLTVEQWKLNEELSACMQAKRMRDNVDQLLDKYPALRIAAQSSLITLNEYMGIMAQSEVYFLATVLCPYYKLEWFVKQEDELARIEELRRMLYRYFARTCPASASTMTTQTQPTTSASSRVSQPTSRWLQTPTRATRAVVPYTPGQEWKRGSPLARIALDLLTAPGQVISPLGVPHIDISLMLVFIASLSSASAGRTFSGSRTAANYRQHRMNLSTFRAKMAVGSWYRTPLLPEIDEVVDVLNDWEGLDPNPLELD